MHRQLTNLPEGDVIVHSGDFTMMGTEGEALDFMEWFCDLPHRHKVFIAGNHDFCLRGARLEGLDENCHYLCNSGVQIDGVKFYGVPMFFEDAINRRAENDFMNIPPDTDVLVTHQPPYDILDLSDEIHYGDPFLSNARCGSTPDFTCSGIFIKPREWRSGTGLCSPTGLSWGGVRSGKLGYSCLDDARRL